MVTAILLRISVSERFLGALRLCSLAIPQVSRGRSDPEAASLARQSDAECLVDVVLEARCMAAAECARSSSDARSMGWRAVSPRGGRMSLAEAFVNAEQLAMMQEASSLATWWFLVLWHLPLSRKKREYH